MNCDEVFGMEQKRFFVLEADKCSITYYKAVKKGEPTNQEGIIEITHECAITVDGQRLVIVSLPTACWKRVGARCPAATLGHSRDVLGLSFPWQVTSEDSHTLRAETAFQTADWGEQLREIRKKLRTVAKSRKQAEQEALDAQQEERIRAREAERVARLQEEEAIREANRAAREAAIALNGEGEGSEAADEMELGTAGKLAREKQGNSCCVIS